MTMTAVTVGKVGFGQHPVADRVIGYEDQRPSLSWRILSAPRGWEQHRAQVEIAQGGQPPRIHDFEGADQICLPWPGTPLKSRQCARARVRVAGEDGIWSPWSDPTLVETGLLRNEDWSGSPIEPDPGVGREDPAPIMVRSFTVGQGCDLGRLDLTAGGIFIPYLDGCRIGSDELTPGWTDYRKRMNALTYDLTQVLTPGRHELAVILGNGWYRGQLTWTCRTEVYGKNLWLLANLFWRDQDGEHRLATDQDWTWRSSPILANDLYDGQTRDMRIPLLNQGGQAYPVRALPMPTARIRPQEAPPARILDRLPGLEIITTPSGGKIVDFGQNVSGWVRMHIRHGQPGQEVVLRHAEVLEKGELGTRPLRNAKATDRFILSGGEEDLEPLFTQHGFRYVEVEGVEDFQARDLEACLVSAEMKPLATFKSSRAELDRLFQNARWSTMDNFTVLPTDCPQRDERLGWTGDIAMFAPTALALFRAGGFLASWLEDMADTQASDGGIPVVVPDVLDGPKLTCGWGDAAVLVPWAIYRATGNKAVLFRFLPMMDRFVDGVEVHCGASRLWRGGFQFGDWLDPDAPPDNPGGSKADPDVVATAYFAHSARLVARAHQALGEEDRADHYSRLADEVARAFCEEYVTANGAIISDCASVYAMALVWDLLETPDQRQGAGDRLADIVRVSGFRISTGFLGTPLVCPALVKSGHPHLAVRLLLQDRCPSWLYPVAMGATTIWERWDSMLPDGSINPGGMTSFNHYALGAIVDWMLEGLAGLQMQEPGWRRVCVSPVVDLAIDHVDISQETPYGLIRLNWAIRGRTFHLELEVPVGIQACVALPGVRKQTYRHGRYAWDIPLDQVCEPSGPIRTIRDLIDSTASMDQLTKALTVSGSPVYTGDQADVAFTKAAKPWLDADLDWLPDVASQQGYVPGADEINQVCRDFLADLEKQDLHTNKKE